HGRDFVARAGVQGDGAAAPEDLVVGVGCDDQYGASHSARPPLATVQTHDIQHGVDHVVYVAVGEPGIQGQAEHALIVAVRHREAVGLEVVLVAVIGV